MEIKREHHVNFWYVVLVRRGAQDGVAFFSISGSPGARSTWRSGN
jgi:hypothetical protein